MNAAAVRVAAFAVFLATALGLIGFALLLVIAADTANGSVLGDKSLRAALDLTLGTGGWIAAAAILLVCLFAYFFSLLALRAYLNRFAGYTGANAPIAGIVGCSAAMLAVAIVGWLAAAGPIVLIVLGILAVLTFVLYLIKGARLRAYGKEQGDRPVRIYGILVTIYCLSMIATLLLSMAAAASPPLLATVSIVGWVVSLIQVAAWIMLGVALRAGARKMQAKELAAGDRVVAGKSGADT